MVLPALDAPLSVRSVVPISMAVLLIGMIGLGSRVISLVLMPDGKACIAMYQIVTMEYQIFMKGDAIHAKTGG